MSSPSRAVMVHSPLPFLIAEEQHRDHQATEALLLSFNIDYGFFETTILGTCRHAGARVSLIGDATVSAPDPRAAREAGITYIPGLAAPSGAFHPKVVVLAGPERAVVAVGSANVSIGGWQHNSELWTVVEATATEPLPAWIVDLAMWLGHLPDQIPISPTAGHGMRRAGQQLSDLASRCSTFDDHCRFVTTSSASILSQLPTGPVDELCLYAPFHDPREEAVNALIEHFSPTTIRLAIQPGATVLDATALKDVASRHDIRIQQDVDASRYRHGKLIEWAQDGQRWALTGSANLSRAALLTSLEDGGNCEAGLISPVIDSLFPGGPDITADTIPTVRISSDRTASRSLAPILLGGSIEPSGLHLTLAHPATQDLIVEASLRADDPDTWVDVGTVPATAVSFDIAVGLTAGSRVRLIALDDCGERHHGNTVFVSHPHHLARMGHHATTSPTFAPPVAALFDDPRTTEEFLTLITRLSEPLAATRLPRVTSGQGERSETGHGVWSDSDEEGWQAHLAAEARRFGPHLMGLVVGGLPALEEDITSPRVWEDLLVDDTQTDLSEDTADALDQEAGSPSDGATDDDEGSPELTEQEARRFRSAWKRLGNLADRLPALHRVLALRLLLLSTESTSWSLTDDECFTTLATATESLAGGTIPSEVEAPAGSAAAVALALMESHTSRHETDARTLRWRTVANAVAHLLPALDEDLIGPYIDGLHDSDGMPLHTDRVISTAERIVDHDPVADAVHRTEQMGRSVHQRGPNLIHVDGPFGNPGLAALQSLAFAEEAPLVGVWATNPQGMWALYVWRAPDLFAIGPGRAGTLWRQYRLDGLMNPAALVARLRTEPGAARDYEVKRSSLLDAPTEGVALLQELGLTGPEPPRRC